MNSWTDEDRKAFRDIDEAIRAEAMLPPAPRLAIGVMQRIRSETLLPLPRFRLTWIDCVLSSFAASMLGLVVILSRTLPPDVELYLRMEAIYWIERIRIDPLTPVFLVGGAVLLVAGVVTIATFTMRLVLNGNQSRA